MKDERDVDMVPNASPAEQQVTVAELDAIVKEIFELREQVALKESEVSELNVKLAEKKQTVVGMLEALGRTNYQTPFGNVYRQEKKSLPLPTAWEDKQAFLNWLKEAKGEEVMRDFITFNAQKLKSFIQAELDAREEEGNLETNFPGLKAPTTFVDLGVRRK